MVAKWWLTIFGAVCVLIGLAHLLIGAPSIIGGGIASRGVVDFGSGVVHAL
ncbi:hypothetical protein MTY66_18720 [Mycolicibacterium sp. TY66]|uniref:hypothetical protein n=1 Tax=unclassified Mycolicibacterium TaxID=2636767 RepID=UPI001BB43B6D|nr:MULTISPECIES: hypothetical protein [unclassified Mycolicibacterium]BCI80247.1 hypothetical protein MTY66_18720 [Mycolicibacterium sp. TY66]BCJ82089.1 hypothetical protein MTY81_34620 [Mycolicibacterium sp. TY81]